MKGLTMVGTAAMFLVGGGILANVIPAVSELFELVLHLINKLTSIGSVLTILVSMLFNGILRIIAGGLLVPVVTVSSLLLSALKILKKREL